MSCYRESRGGKDSSALQKRKLYPGKAGSGAAVLIAEGDLTIRFDLNQPHEKIPDHILA